MILQFFFILLAFALNSQKKVGGFLIFWKEDALYSSYIKVWDFRSASMLINIKGRESNEFPK